MNVVKLNRGSSDGNPCELCGEHHVPANKCRHDLLAAKVRMLTDANKMIPALLQVNKDNVATMETFRILLRQADKAHEFMLEILSEYENGEEIKNKYLARLDEWVAKSLNLGTEQQEQGTENSTLNETNDKPSTENQTTGETLQ